MTAVPPLAALVAMLWASFALADTFPPALPFKGAAASVPLDQRVRTLVQTQCASCHENGALAVAPQSFGAAFDVRALSLSDLAADPGYVRPGFAEASPLFQKLISRHRPSDLGPGGLAAEEILAVRDWIESLPQPSTCPVAASVEIATPSRSDTLIVTLGSLHGPCDPAGRLPELRAAADVIFSALARDRVFEVQDANGLVFAADASRLSGLTGADLEALRAIMAVGPVGLDRLAAYVLERGLRFGDDALPRVASLARIWTRDVDLRRAALETGVTVEALTEKLSSLSGDAKLQAQRLMAGALPRDAWENLKSVISGASASMQASPPPKGAIDLVLSSDGLRVKRGALVALEAEASVTCHLTIVSIDPEGRAIVLYPNEIEDENLIARGVRVKVPGPTAGYQVRFDKPGTETFVAICQRGRTTLDGVKVDYEKQRFPVLGDWRGFLAVMDDRQTQLEKQKTVRDTRRSRRRGRGSEEPAKPAAPPVDPKANEEGWAALRIIVE